MVETGATPRQAWRKSTWALAIGTGLALLVICLTWLRQGDMPWPLVAVAVGWIVLAPPIYDHSWPAKAFLIWTVLAAGLLMPLVAESANQTFGLSLAALMSCPSCYEHVGKAMIEAFIVMCWLVGAAILAAIRLFVWYRHSVAALRAERQCFSCGAVNVIGDCWKCGYHFERYAGRGRER